MILCGGRKYLTTYTNCLRLAAGASEWEQFATISARQSHTSWVAPSGKLLLLGGEDGNKNLLSSTEVVGEGVFFSLQRAAR